MHRFSIIGPGRIGGALAIALSRSGYEIADIVFRSKQPKTQLINAIGEPRLVLFSEDLRLSSDVVIIATADQDIVKTANDLVEKLEGKPVVLHTSGSLSSDVLGHLREIGCPAGSMHPLISVNDPIAGSESLQDAFFCIEGDAKATETANEIVRILGGKPFTIETELKPLYHAAAVMACGHLTALIDIATDMLSDAGIPTSKTKEMLLPLIKSTVSNIASGELKNALTGSFARGDLEAIDRHINALKLSASSSELSVYLLLGMRSLELAESAGLDPEKVEIIRKRISMEKSNLKC